MPWTGWLVLALSLLAISPTLMAQTLSQTERQKLLASDAEETDRFGNSVALSGNRLLVGANRDDHSGSRTGSVYVYEFDTATGTWLEAAKLTASDAAAGDDFGLSIALSGDRALVGAPSDDDAGSKSGSAYVFDFNVDTGRWSQVAKLSASDAAEDDRFGHSVSLSGDQALVGAFQDDDVARESGSAYVFELDEQTGLWAETAKLTASDAGSGVFPGFSGDAFGHSVALAGDRVLVGAFSDDIDPVNGIGRDSGSAYVFERDKETGLWAEVAKLTASDAAAGDLFGWSIALSGDRALVGAFWDDDGGSGSGSAYVFERDEQTGLWEETAKLNAVDAARSDQFGISVALSGDRALVGANHDDDRHLESTGSAYVFEFDEQTGTWSQVARLTASDAAARDDFGLAVSLFGDRALIGAEYNDDARFDSGSAYVFDIASPSDEDQDGVIDANDNCPADSNPFQENFDDDRLGDACDSDDDNDGVEDNSDPFPLNPALPGGSGLPALVIGSVDNGKYGFRFEGVSNHREILERFFDASGSDVTLTVTGYDIDTRQEVRVLVNGTEIGFLLTSNNNGRRISKLRIPQRLLNNAGKNTLRFEQSNSGWSWGVTRLLLTESNDSGELPLVLDSMDSGRYGFRFEGVNSHRAVLERQFDANGSDLSLTLTGYDIDSRQEVRVLVNGTQIGFLAETPNNARSSSKLLIAQSLLNGDGNTLRFEQSNPGWRWGVSDLLLSATIGTE